MQQAFRPSQIRPAFQALAQSSRLATSNTATPPPDVMRSATADLCDKFLPDPVDIVTEKKVSILQPIFRQALEEDGKGRVLVVDGGASMRCALLGDNIAEMGYKNGWSGIIINGCIRDSDDIEKMPLGVKALNTYPLKSAKRDKGLRDIPITIAGAQVRPGDWIYADKDGVLVSPEELQL